MPPGSLPAVGSVRPKQPISSPVAMPGSHCCFCSSEPCLWMALIASDPCTRDEGAQAGVAGLQFQRGQAVLDGAAAGAAVALQVHAEQAELAQLRDDLAREDGLLVPVGDVRPDPLSTKARTLSRSASSSAVNRESKSMRSLTSDMGGAFHGGLQTVGAGRCVVFL